MMSSATPRNTNESGSVTMMAGYRPIATKAPTMAPTPAPSPRSARTPPKIPSGPCMVDAATTEPRLTIGPTERSIPPVSMTMVSAAATIAVGNQP
jgi:hypothetical protein